MNLITPAVRAHQAHMDRLKEMYSMGHSTDDIRQYIDAVRSSEGRFRGDALRKEFGEWWKKQQEVKA
jgi:hypothetical protein